MRHDQAAVRASLLNRLVARAPRYARYIRENPGWIVMFLGARTLAGRRAERLVRRARYTAPAADEGSTAFPEFDRMACVQSLVRDGIAFGLRLPVPIVADINAFAANRQCFARDRQDRGFMPADVGQANAERAHDVLAGYYFDAVEDCPAITALRDDPTLKAIAAAYVGQSAQWNRTRLWWSFPAKRVSDSDLHTASQDKFHFDLNGWGTLKFFFYLTPVGEQDGPHRCIPGTHRSRPLQHQFTLTVGRATEELERVYGKDRFLTITGPAGMGFAEDPYIFHTGSLCRGRPRLILEIEFGAAAAVPSYHYGRLG